MGQDPDTNQLEGRLWKVAYQCLSPWQDSQLPLAVPRSSLKSASRSDPGVFQTIGSAKGLRTCEISCVPYKNKVSVSFSLQLSWKKALQVFKARPAGFFSSQRGNPGLSSLMRGSDPSLLVEDLYRCDVFQHRGSLCSRCGFQLDGVSNPTIHLVVSPSSYL